jgi:uncharacterized protein YmfQ (DUF2313 family)
MALFLRIYQHLLPRARAWSVVVEKFLRQFFEGLTGLPSDVKDFIDNIWFDIFPETTRQLAEWEAQFGIIAPAATEAERRETLAAQWMRGGGLGPDTLQDVLQSAGFPLFVHDPWYFTPAKAIRNPNLYLIDGDTDLVYVVECGEALAECGEPAALCGDTSTPTGTLLVNKVLERVLEYTVGCGEPLMECGEALAQCGENTGFISGFKPYIIPSDPALWPYFWYIGGETFGDSVTIPSARKDELETLILKIGPAHLWAGLFVNYS